MHAIEFNQKDTLQSSFSATPPWLLGRPRVNVDLHCFHKEDTAPDSEVDFTSCALIMMVFIQYTLTVQRTVIEWRRLLLPERNSAKTVRLPYHTKQTF